MNFLVTALRWGWDDTHHYVVGLFTARELAERAAELEEAWRGGKYQCVITELEALGEVPTRRVDLGDGWGETEVLDVDVETPVSPSEQALRQLLDARGEEITRLRARELELVTAARQLLDLGFRFSGATMEGPRRDQEPSPRLPMTPAARAAYWRLRDLVSGGWPDTTPAGLRDEFERAVMSNTSPDVRPLQAMLIRLYASLEP